MLSSPRTRGRSAGRPRRFAGARRIRSSAVRSSRPRPTSTIATRSAPTAAATPCTARSRAQRVRCMPITGPTSRTPRRSRRSARILPGSEKKATRSSRSSRWIRSAPMWPKSSSPGSTRATTSARRLPSPRRISTCPRSRTRSARAGSRSTGRSSSRTMMSS